jgi:beta-lactamase class A
MVAVSDNSATNVVIDRVGMQNVNSMLDSLGLTHTRLQRKMMDVKAAQAGRENLSTPREMMAFFAELYHGKVLNKELTDDYFKLLSTHKESDIPRFIPDDVMIANKPGELAGVRNDMGVVFAPKRPFVIVVMTAYLQHERDGNDAIAKIAGAAFDYFDRVGRSSEYGRIVNERNSH